jgi:hypothetical protein
VPWPRIGLPVEVPVSNTASDTGGDGLFCPRSRALENLLVQGARRASAFWSRSAQGLSRHISASMALHYLPQLMLKI